MTPEPYILSLNQIAANSISLVGGKAAKLGEMKQNGFNVPDGFVLTTSAYRHLVESSDFQKQLLEVIGAIDYDDASSIQTASTNLAKIVNQMEIPDTILTQIKGTYGSLMEKRVAVRSSATAEDLQEASFAGQYETFLNVKGMSDLVTNIRKCYASLWTPRAISYRYRNKIPHDAVRIAVLVQSMVDADRAGVLFTDDPTVPSQTQMLIESNFGLGESVVSGVATPDRYVVSRKDNPRYKEHRLLFSEIGTKDVIIRSGGITETGVTTSTTTDAISQKASLSEDEAIQLAEIGYSLERFFKGPQDVEWAIDTSGNLHVLQSRPITVQRHSESQEILWSRGYSDDYWNDNVTPLFFDLLGDQIKYIVNVELNQIMGYKGMPSEILKLYKAHAYFNLEVIRNKVVNEIPPFLRSDDVLNYFPEGNGPYGKETMRDLPFATKNRILAEIRVMAFDSQGSMTKTADEYKKWTEEEFIPYLDKFDSNLEKLRNQDQLAELWELAKEIDKVMIRHFRMVRYGIPVHNIGMNLIVNYLLRRWMGESRAVRLFPLLVTGLKHKTNETNQRLSELANLGRRMDDVRKLILGTPSDQLYSEFEKQDNEDKKQFFLSFSKFLEDFGVRGYTREPYYPRWGEKPSLVFDILKPLMAAQGSDPLDQDSRVTQMRLDAEEEVEAGIKSTRNGKIKWMLFNTILGMSRTYIAFREDQRFNLDRWITRNRALFLQMGRILKHRGVIERPEDIFFFYKSEIKLIVNNGPETLPILLEKLRERKKEFDENEDMTPPKFIQGSRVYNDRLGHSEDDTTLVGLPASQGTLTGYVRVLRKIEEIPLVKEGEILVVPRTDPGWTPVFAQIGGLVTETGGILSHGAVVSREYCIPAVTNIRQACDILKTGQRITVDGNKGTITFHDDHE
ncbi:MAG: PEP/pyruvate-binding domain-containing protein [Candidatus Thorarchaeota archaeon]